MSDGFIVGQVVSSGVVKAFREMSSQFLPGMFFLHTMQSCGSVVTLPSLMFSGQWLERSHCLCTAKSIRALIRENREMFF